MDWKKKQLTGPFFPLASTAGKAMFLKSIKIFLDWKKNLLITPNPIGFLQGEPKQCPRPGWPADTFPSALLRWTVDLFASFLLQSWQVCIFTTRGSQTPAGSEPQNGIHNMKSHATVTYNSTTAFPHILRRKRHLFGGLISKQVSACYIGRHYHPPYSWYTVHRASVINLT